MISWVAGFGELCNIALRGRRVWWLTFDFLAGLIAVLRYSASICG